MTRGVGHRWVRAGSLGWGWGQSQGHTYSQTNNPSLSNCSHSQFIVNQKHDVQFIGPWCRSFTCNMSSGLVFPAPVSAELESSSPSASSWRECVTKEWLISSRLWRCSGRRDQLWSRLRSGITHSQYTESIFSHTSVSVTEKKPRQIFSETLCFYFPLRRTSISSATTRPWST